MLDELRAMAIFARTVECGSLRAAARALGLSPSVVSHHLSHLEKRLGVALLYRSTRRLSLTPDGERLLESARAMVGAAETGLNAVSRPSPELTGRLSLTLPALFSTGWMIDALAAFCTSYSKVSLSVSFSDLKRDLVGEGIDLALRVGVLKDSSLRSKKLFELTRRLVVSRSYASRRPVPRRPEDLRTWDWLGLQMRPDVKLLTHQHTGEIFRLEFRPRLRADNVEAVCRFAVAGLGLATPPAFLADPELRSGRLLEPLPEWRVDSLGVYALWPANASRSAAARALLDFLVARADFPRAATPLERLVTPRRS